MLLDFAQPSTQYLVLFLTPASPLLQVRQLDDTGLISINETLDFAPDCSQFAFEALPLLFLAWLYGGITMAFPSVSISMRQTAWP